MVLKTKKIKSLIKYFTRFAHKQKSRGSKNPHGFCRTRTCLNKQKVEVRQVEPPKGCGVCRMRADDLLRAEQTL